MSTLEYYKLKWSLETNLPIPKSNTMVRCTRTLFDSFYQTIFNILEETKSLDKVHIKIIHRDGYTSIRIFGFDDTTNYIILVSQLDILYKLSDDLLYYELK